MKPPSSSSHSHRPPCTWSVKSLFGSSVAGTSSCTCAPTPPSKEARSIPRSHPASSRSSTTRTVAFSKTAAHSAGKLRPPCAFVVATRPTCSAVSTSFSTFDQPHRCAGRDSGEELRSPIEDRLEIAGLLLDPSPQRRDEHLPKLLVPAELAAGAFFPDNLLDERSPRHRRTGMSQPAPIRAQSQGLQLW